MAELSKRAQGMPASPIRRLVPHAEEAVRRGVHVHHLNIGQPDIETPRAMLEAYHKFDAKVLAYGPSEGLLELRTAVSEYYGRIGNPVDPDQVHVTTGGSEALIFAFSAVCDPGEEIVVFEPFYANYAGFAQMLGVCLRPVVTSQLNGFHLPPDEIIERAISTKTKAILICSPGNPTGTVLSQEEMNRLGALAEKHDLFIIADEVYREFVYDGVSAVSALSLPYKKDRAIIVDSVSKRFSACGARIGFLITKNRDLLGAFRRLAFARLCPATVAQKAAAAAYRMAPSYFDPIVSEYEARRNLLIEGLSQIPGVQCYKPEGAFYAIVTLPVEDADDFAVWLLREFQHQGQTVMLAPGGGFYATPGLGKNEVRIAYVLNVDALAKSVQILDRALAEYPNRQTLLASTAN